MRCSRSACITREDDPIRRVRSPHRTLAIQRETATSCKRARDEANRLASPESLPSGRSPSHVGRRRDRRARTGGSPGSAREPTCPPATPRGRAKIWAARGLRRASRLPYASGLRRPSRRRIRAAARGRELRRNREAGRRHRLDRARHARRRRRHAVRAIGRAARTAARRRRHRGRDQIRLRPRPRERTQDAARRATVSASAIR